MTEQTCKHTYISFSKDNNVWIADSERTLSAHYITLMTSDWSEEFLKEFDTNV